MALSRVCRPSQHRTERPITSIPARATFVYRGQLHVELSRIQFLLAAVCATFGEVDAVLLSPGSGATADEFEAFARQFPNVRTCSFVPAGRTSQMAARRRVATLVAPDAATIVAVGFSAAAFLPDRRCLVWCVNGIPEERLLHRRTLAQRLAVWLAWRAAKRLRAQCTVVVSQPMADLMEHRVGGRQFVVPNAVDLSVFEPSTRDKPVYLTYQGGGSPWQGLDRLALVWRELYAIAPHLRFRVITTDPRAHVLAEGLPNEAVEIGSTHDPREMAAMLGESRLGFLFRAPDVVNEVSWPMKLGEYLAAGTPVVVTRCGWDAERLIEQHAAGLVVDWDASPADTARRIAEYVELLDGERPAGLATAAAALSASLWGPALQAEMTAVASGSRERVES